MQGGVKYESVLLINSIKNVLGPSKLLQRTSTEIWRGDGDCQSILGTFDPSKLHQTEFYKIVENRKHSVILRALI